MPIATVIAGPTLLIPNGSESQLEHSSNPSPFNHDRVLVVPPPQTSQQLATERLARVYNSDRGLSPMPSRPVDELSDDESFEITSVIDETRKAVRFAKEKASFEAASRLAAERKAEENQALSPQTAFSDEKKSVI
jgi:TFIIF-interacting CTD phosphatase-like protein